MCFFNHLMEEMDKNGCVKPKRASGKRAKKRRFHGNQHTRYGSNDQTMLTGETHESMVCENPVEESFVSTTVSSAIPESASKRKLKDSFIECDSSETETKRNSSYIFFDKNILFSFMEEYLLCQSCESEVKVTQKNVRGLSCELCITCKTCKRSFTLKNSKIIGDSKNTPEINKRCIYAMRCIGQGLEPLKTFCGIMDLDPPVTQNAYDEICSHINTASKSVAIDVMKRAAEEEVSKTSSSDVTVSGDGTWKTRGHTSQIGVCSVIGAKSGKVLDLEVLSLACKVCSAWKGKRSGKDFEEWYASHADSCTKNHEGSSAKMEVDGMVKIFHRSVEERGVRYTRYIGDGDTKTFSSICNSKPYNDMLPMKIECVGHVQKRMGSRLRKLKQDYRGKTLSDGRGLSGKGRLTDSLINKLTSYYGNAIRQHSNSVEDMRTAVWAVYFHTRSTDQEPLHSFCPKGPNSWCKYTQAVENGTVSSFQHKTTIPAAVMDVIKPIFKALCHPDLLNRCLGSHTQNSNESFHSVIWQICPKVSGSGKKISEIAAYEAAILFNEGHKGRLSVMRALDIYPGVNAIIAQFRRDARRVKLAEKRKLCSTVDVRRAKRRAKLSLNEKNVEAEGIIYEPGGF